MMPRANCLGSDRLAEPSATPPPCSQGPTVFNNILLEQCVAVEYACAHPPQSTT